MGSEIQRGNLGYLQQCQNKAIDSLRQSGHQDQSGVHSGRKVTFLGSIKNYLISTRAVQTFLQFKSFVSRTIKSVSTLKLSIRQLSTLEKLMLTGGVLSLWNPLIWPLLAGYGLSLLKVTRDADVSCGNGDVTHFKGQPPVDLEQVEMLCKAVEGDEYALSKILIPTQDQNGAPPSKEDKIQIAKDMLLDIVRTANAEITKEELQTCVQQKIADGESGEALISNLKALLDRSPPSYSESVQSENLPFKRSVSFDSGRGSTSDDGYVGQADASVPPPEDKSIGKDM